MKSARADSERFCSQARFGKRGNTLCIARFSNRRLRAKDPLLGRRRFYLGLPPIKRERGECVIHPAVAPVSLLGAYSVCFDLRTGASGGQNLAALRTTAGQNLAAVGSRHSLAETVNLGTVTPAGLIGTLHLGYTSCQNTICSTAFRPQQHMLRLILQSYPLIITEKHCLVNLFLFFCQSIFKFPPEKVPSSLERTRLYASVPGS